MRRGIQSLRRGLLLAAALLAATALITLISPTALSSKNEFGSGLVPEFAYPYSDQQEFWINSPPLSVRSLRGRAFLVEFWTFGCINCRRSIPWVRDIEEKFAGTGFVVIGVHTPEFEHERDSDAVRDAVVRLGITHPVMLDNDFIYWKDMDNHYWPAYHLVDAAGKLVATFIGEIHSGTEKADRIEQLILTLL